MGHGGVEGPGECLMGSRKSREFSVGGYSLEAFVNAEASTLRKSLEVFVTI